MIVNMISIWYLLSLTISNLNGLVSGDPGVRCHFDDHRRESFRQGRI